MSQELLRPRRKASKLLGSCYELAEVLCSAMVAVAVLFAFVVRFANVVGFSMEPTLRDRQTLVLSPMVNGLKHGDIVVVSEEGTRIPPPNGPEVIVKRVVGLPGDVIDIDFDACVVYRNGVALVEDYIAEPTRSSGDVEFPVTVSDGAVFLLGDNRNRSIDSRESCVGLVDQRYILGRVMFK